MRTARIAIDGRALIEPAGGLRRYAEEILSRLPELADDLDWELVCTRRIPLPHTAYALTVLPGSINALARPLWEDFTLTRAMHDSAADVFFSPYGVVPNLDIPVVAMVHDLVAQRLPDTLPWHHRRYWKRVARRLPRADRVLTNSRATADDIAALTSVTADRITVTHLAPASVFAPAGAEQVNDVCRRLGIERPYVLSVGGGTPRKNLAAVAAAVNAIPGLELIRVGRAQADGGPGRHLGAVDDEVLAILMSGAIAVVCPSRLEGFGLPVVEAMACGAPVVASGTPAVEEIAGGAAVLVATADVSAWSRALSRLNSDPHYRLGYRQAGLARSRAFSWETTARATLEAIRAALPGS